MSHDKPEVPEGYQELLEELSYEVLKQRPADFIQFSINFLESRKGSGGGYIRKSNAKGLDSDDPLRNNRDYHFQSCPGVSMFDDRNHSSSAELQRRVAIASEKFNPDACDDGYELKKNPKSPQEIEHLRKVAMNVILFRDIDEDDLNALIGSMYEMNVNAGDVIIKQGDDGDNFYVIDGGIFTVSISNNGKATKVLEYNESGSFGELALLYNTPRAATITAETDGHLWVINRESFRAIILKNAYRRRKEFDKLLSKVEILNALSAYERSQITDSIKYKRFNESDTIITEGEPGSEMFFICKGSVKVCKKTDEEQKIICELNEGDYFGELALIKKQARSASIFANSELKLAILDADSFERLLGPCKKQINDRIESYLEI